MKDTKKNLTFEYEGKNYKLEYTASSLKKLERSGFSFADIEKHALTAAEELFCGAFIANHSNVPRKTRLEIYAQMAEESDDGDMLTEAIFGMVEEAVEEINSHKGNLKWSLN